MGWNMQGIGTGRCREFASGWETEEERLRLLGDRAGNFKNPSRLEVGLDMATNEKQ